MANEWRNTNLGELLKFSNGKKSPERSGGAGNPVYGSNGIIGYAETANSAKNSLIIGRVGTFCGSVYFSSKECWVTDNAIKASAIDGNNPIFLYYLLKHLNLNQWREGSGQPLINQSILKGIEVLTPSSTDQDQIAIILGSLDEKIETNRQTNQTLEAMAQALFKSWFVDFDPVIDNALAAGHEIPPELQARAEARKSLQARAEQRKASLSGDRPEQESGNILPESIRQLFPNRFVLDAQMGWIPEGWEVKPIYSLAAFVNGAAYKAFDPNKNQQGLPIIKIAELKAGITPQTGFSNVEMPEKYRLKDEDILFS